MSEEIEVFALRYATMHGRKTSEVYLRYDLYGLPERTLDMDCYFWLVRSAAGVTLVDSGWNRRRGLPRTGRYSHIAVDESDPVDLLARVGLSPRDVDNVVVSHMHFDHIGNLDLYPHANLILSRTEYECYTGPLAANPVFSLSVLPDEVAIIEGFRERGQLRLVEGAEEILPGVTATPVGGHTPGHTLVEVATGSGDIVLASDAVHYHEEMDENRPFYHYSDLVAMLETYQSLRTRAAAPHTQVISGHDPIEMTRFAAVADDIVDLTKPLG